MELAFTTRIDHHHRDLMHPIGDHGFDERLGCPTSDERTSPKVNTLPK